MKLSLYVNIILQRLFLMFRSVLMYMTMNSLWKGTCHLGFQYNMYFFGHFENEKNFDHCLLQALWDWTFFYFIHFLSMLQIFATKQFLDGVRSNPLATTLDKSTIHKSLKLNQNFSFLSTHNLQEITCVLLGGQCLWNMQEY